MPVTVRGKVLTTQNTLLSTLSIDDGELPCLSPPCTPCSPNVSAPIYPQTPCTPCSPTVFKDAFVFQPPGHPKQVMIDNEVWPPIFKAEFVRSAKKIIPLSTDVFVCTYPKCGTTWIQHICSQLLQEQYEPEQGKVSELCLSSPMIERMGAKYTNDLKHPRLLKTHFSYRNCPKSSQAKYIFAVRNPKDCLTSYYFHNKNFKIYEWSDGDFNIFFDLFIKGELGFGDYFKHLKSWLPHLKDSNVLFLKYEEMFADLEATVLKIGNFLGGRAESLVNNPKYLKCIVEESKIDSMKQNQTRWFPGSVLHAPTFIRKGGSRDWKNYMTKEQSDALDKLYQKKLGGTVAENWWQAEMSWEELYTTRPVTQTVFTFGLTLPEEEPENDEPLRNQLFSLGLKSSTAFSFPQLNALMLAECKEKEGSVTSSGYSSLYSSNASLAN